MLPSCFVCNAERWWLGAQFFSGSGHRHFRNSALLILAVIGVVTLGLAVRDYAF